MENFSKINSSPDLSKFTKPKKYDKLIHKTTQIPKISIIRLIE